MDVLSAAPHARAAWQRFLYSLVAAVLVVGFGPTFDALANHGTPITIDGSTADWDALPSGSVFTDKSALTGDASDDDRYSSSAHESNAYDASKYTTGASTPSKEDLAKIYIHSDKSSGILWLGALTADGNGSHRVYFEFNLTDWSATPNSPVRSAGDLRVEANFGGGNFTVWKWNGTSWQSLGNASVTGATSADDSFHEVELDLTALIAGGGLTCDTFGAMEVRGTTTGGSGDPNIKDKAGPYAIDLSLCPSLVLDKQVSDDGVTWDDADSTPGLSVDAGDDVWFRIYAENDGNVALTNFDITDAVSAGGAAALDLTTCTTPVPSTLAAGATYECVLGPFAAVSGQHTNTITASNDNLPDATDDANYNGATATPGLTLDKKVSDDGVTWNDADSTPGLSVDAGDDVWFRIDAENTGNVDLTNFDISDAVSAGGAPALDLGDCTTAVPGTLGAGDTYECVLGPFTAVEGQHTNTITASSTELADVTDDANYNGAANPGLQLDKQVSNVDPASGDFVAWDDADSPGLVVPAGDDVWFRVYAENTGNVSLDNVDLSDAVSVGEADALNFDDCDPAVPAALGVGDTYECVLGPFAAVTGLHTNTVTATSDDLVDPVEDSATYFGGDGQLDLEKYVSVVDPASEDFVDLDDEESHSDWQDADSTDGQPVIDSGDSAWFRFDVANVGNIDLTDFSLTDDKVDLSSCDIPDTLPAADTVPGDPDDHTLTCVVGPIAIVGQHTNTATASGTFNPTVTVTDQANVLGRSSGGNGGGGGGGGGTPSEPPVEPSGEPSIRVQELVTDTFGGPFADANEEPGVTVTVGDPVWVRFVVTNVGSTSLNSLTLREAGDIEGAVTRLVAQQVTDGLADDCTLPATLASGASVTCTVGPLTLPRGRYSSLTTATGAFEGTTVEDDDPAHLRVIAPLVPSVQPPAPAPTPTVEHEPSEPPVEPTEEPTVLPTTVDRTPPPAAPEPEPEPLPVTGSSTMVRLLGLAMLAVAAELLLAGRRRRHA